MFSHYHDITLLGNKICCWASSLGYQIGVDTRHWNPYLCLTGVLCASCLIVKNFSFYDPFENSSRKSRPHLCKMCNRIFNRILHQLYLDEYLSMHVSKAHTRLFTEANDVQDRYLHTGMLASATTVASMNARSIMLLKH
jgi:hypothetical protein